MDLLARVRRRSRREWLVALLVGGGLIGFVAVVFAVLVLGVGTLIGRTAQPGIGLSIVATATVALAFDPVQRRLSTWASQAVHGANLSPYDVLRGFSRSVTDTHVAEELPARMARVLAEGTGAQWTQVWLVVGDQPTVAATWPPSAAGVGHLGEERPGLRSVPVRYGDEVLGVLVLQERHGRPLTSVEHRLFEGLATQSRLVLRGARLRAALEARAAELAAHAEELRRSRQRLVDAQDDARRRLERDIHDGAQQHLVALAVNLRLAETVARTDPDRAAVLLRRQARAAGQAVETLRLLSQGIYPALLVERGPAAALRDAVEASPIPVLVTAEGVGRHPSHIEAAAYFCCLEAVQNALKHAGATAVRVSLGEQDGLLTIDVEDDGGGFDPSAAFAGVGLANIRVRLESVDGTLTVESVPGGGSRVSGRIPGPGG